MTEPKPALDPSDAKAVKDFDLGSWIGGSKLPQRSTVVYQRPDLYSEIDAIEREIRLAGGDDDETSVSQQSKVGKLRRQYDKVAKEIADSALKVTVRAATDDATKQARRAVKAEGVREAAKTSWDEDGHADEAEDDARMQAESADLEPEKVEAFIRARVGEAKRAFVAAHAQVAFADHLLTRLLIEPKPSSVEQTRDFLAAIGADQAAKVYELVALASQDRQMPSAPFLQPSSRARGGGTSSKG